MALTATASVEVREDITKQLKFMSSYVERTRRTRLAKGGRDSKTFVASFDRPNLSWQIVPKTVAGCKEEALEQILELCQEHRFNNKCGIVYCRTREDTETIAQYLDQNGGSACHYHAGMTVGDKKWVSVVASGGGQRFCWCRAPCFTNVVVILVVVPGTEQLDERLSSYCVCNNCIWDGDR